MTTYHPDYYSEDDVAQIFNKTIASLRSDAARRKGPPRTKVGRTILYNKAFIETTIGDIEMANELIQEVLLQKCDDLSKPGRDFLERLKDWPLNTDKTQFQNYEVRAALQMPYSTQKRLMIELREKEFITVASGSQNQDYTYAINQGFHKVAMPAVMSIGIHDFM